MALIFFHIYCIINMVIRLQMNKKKLPVIIYYR